jgi:pimeloyl-ACP methyl ester carboxylesterase
VTRGRTIPARPTGLPPAVTAVLAAPDPGPGEASTTQAAGIPFASIAWGDPAARPLVLLHGVTASARIWWRVGPALAAAGHRVTAPDLPGHGLTGHWLGHYRFRDNAADVAAWIRAAGLDVPGLQVVGHSWGGMTAAALPLAGIRPATLVLLDPPTVPHAVISMMASDPSQRPYPDLESAVAGLAAANPTWPAGDVEAKADALVRLDANAALGVLLDNGDWDGGLADLSEPAADGLDIWLVRGDPAAGGYVPDAALTGFAARIGDDHILTLAGAPHAPQRTHPEATTAALLATLEGPAARRGS